MVEYPDEARDTGDSEVTLRWREAAAREAPKHRRLLRTPRHGRILSALMLPGFAVHPPQGFGILTTTGRRTGRRRRKCMRIVRQGNRAYLVSLRLPDPTNTHPGFVAGWVWNIRSNPRVRVRLPGGSVSGTAREISDPGELASARTALRETVHRFDYAECRIHLRGRPDRAKVVALHEYWFDTGTPLVVDLDA